MYIAPNLTVPDDTPQKLYVQNNESIYDENDTELFKLVRIKRAFRISEGENTNFTKGAEVLDVGIPARNEENSLYFGKYEKHKDTSFQRLTLPYVVLELASIVFGEQTDTKFEKRAQRFVALYTYHCLLQRKNVEEALVTLSTLTEKNGSPLSDSDTVTNDIARIMHDSEVNPKFKDVLETFNTKENDKITRFFNFKQLTRRALNIDSEQSKLLARLLHR